MNPKSRDPKTFFFFDYQGEYIRQGQTYISTVPTAAYRRSNFSGAAQTIYDPLTQVRNAQGQYVRSAFSGNMIPANLLDPVGQNLINLFPQPNLSGNAGNYLYNPVRAINERDYDARVDRRFSDYDSAWVRFSWSNSDLPNPAVFRRQPWALDPAFRESTHSPSNKPSSVRTTSSPHGASTKCASASHG